MNWINRKCKLPPKTDLYLVCTKYGRVCEAYWKDNEYKFTKRWGEEIKNVTHWMCMPDAPNNKNK